MAANRLPGKSCCFDGNRLMISTDTLQHSILCKLYLEAAHDLLVVYGLKTNLVPEPASATSLGNKPSHVSVLGATGDGIALSSVVKVDQDLLTRLYPLGSSADVSRHELEDWCRELNNQLVGRTKNKLCRYGVILKLGLPLLLTGTAVSTVAASDLTVTEQSFRSMDGQLALTLATLVSPDVELHEQNSETECEASMLETAVKLF